MVRTLDDLEEQVKGGRDFDTPPLEKWHPPLSGDIPIVIKRDGTWFHDGGQIKRESLVRLFASILRREEDGEYYLVTPVEKWRIKVEAHALLATDIDTSGENGHARLVATLNTGRQVPIGPEHPLFLDPVMGDVAAIELPHGLTAVFTRAAWYRLVDMAEEVDGTPQVRSAGEVYALAPA